MRMKNDDVELIKNAYLQIPKTNEWKKIDTSKIYYDGIANIALIQTDINLSVPPVYCLRLSNETIKEGNICYVVTNPSNYDEDSISVGFVRSANYCDKYGRHTVNSLFVSATTLGGFSGSPVINKNGDIIGILTFNQGTDSFNGGANAEVLSKVLPMLKTLLEKQENNTDVGINISKNNKDKLYLGLKWNVPSPFTMKEFYNADADSFDTKGVCIEQVTTASSPFHPIFKNENKYLLLSCEILNSNDEVTSQINFGYTEDQRTPGVLLYYPKDTKLRIKFINGNEENKPIRDGIIILDKTYKDIPHINDYMNTGAL